MVEAEVAAAMFARSLSLSLPHRRATKVASENRDQEEEPPALRGSWIDRAPPAANLIPGEEGTLHASLPGPGG